MLKGKTIVLGVTGSIAAYKMANVASMLVKRGCEVHVVMTKNATNFINPIAFESLTNTKCLVETFDRNFQFHVAHVSLTDKADAMLIAPASANIIGKIANGIADDMLSTTVMACNKPVIISVFFLDFLIADIRWCIICNSCRFDDDILFIASAYHCIVHILCTHDRNNIYKHRGFDRCLSCD